jgi:Ice-binding-like
MFANAQSLLRKKWKVTITTFGAEPSVLYEGSLACDASAAHGIPLGISQLEEIHMNRSRNLIKPLTWFMALLLAASVAGCGGDGDGSPDPSRAAAGPTGKVSSSSATGNVPLGAAGNYAILAKTGVANVPISVVTGNVGLSPAARPFLTGWSQTQDVTDTYGTSAQVLSPGKLYAADMVGGTTSSDLGIAVLNMQTAYTDAAGRTASSAATTNVGGGTLTNLTFNALGGGATVYEWGSAVTIPTNLTFNGTATDVFILKVAGTLTMAAAQSVILTGAVLPENIFWQVSGAVTIGANTSFSGVVLGQTSITMGNLSSIRGRLLAQTAVTLAATTVTVP